jgi:quercetin dioxygenase-like cupin family protein
MIPARLRRPPLPVLAAAVLGCGLGIALESGALAQQPGVSRSILLRADEPGSTTHEAVMAVVELAPGASSGSHRHPGIEIGYVLDGSVRLEHEGRPAATLKAGESFRNDGGHNAANPGDRPAKILAVYLVEKGKPLAEPVK